MKKILIISVLAVTFTSLMIGCKKELKLEAGIRPVDTQNRALLKIVNASAYTVIDSVQLKIDDIRVSNSIRYTTPFPGGGLNTGGSNFPWYLDVNPGAINISFTVPKKWTNFDSLHLFSTTVNLEAGKYYTLYTADTSIKTQTVLVTENMTPVPNGVSRFKFVNLMPNLPALDLYFADQLVVSNVAYKSVSPEFTIASGTIGKWAIRRAGDPSTSAAIVTYPTGTTNQTIPNRTNFSVFSRGYNGAASNRAPNISLLYN